MSIPVGLVALAVPSCFPSSHPLGPSSPEPWHTHGQCPHPGYCGQQTFRKVEGGGKPGALCQASSAVPGCFSKDQVYLDGILRILRHRQTIDFPLLAALGKVTARVRVGREWLISPSHPIPSHPKAHKGSLDLMASQKTALAWQPFSSLPFPALMGLCVAGKGCAG